jgi:hypothetical protein
MDEIAKSGADILVCRKIEQIGTDRADKNDCPANSFRVIRKTPFV